MCIHHTYFIFSSQALASTLNIDHTATHYKYHDDPYLIPSSNVGKRTFALAKESGRKAAQWIMKEHPELFNASAADPAIPVSINWDYFIQVEHQLQDSFNYWTFGTSDFNLNLQ